MATAPTLLHYNAFQLLYHSFCQVTFTAPAATDERFWVEVSADSKLLEGFPRSVTVLEFVIEPAEWQVASLDLRDNRLSGACVVEFPHAAATRGL